MKKSFKLLTHLTHLAKPCIRGAEPSASGSATALSAATGAGAKKER